MLELQSAVFIRATTELAAMWTLLEHVRTADPTAIISRSDSGIAKLAAAAQYLRDASKALELPGSAVAFDRLAAALNGGEEITYENLRKTLDRTLSRIPDELGGRAFFALNPRDHGYFVDPDPFGPTVSSQFPSADYDISEAAKCLALGRSTASAFHSIRCLEITIRAIARCLDIPDPTKPAERNWGKILTAINQEMTRRWSTSDRMHGDGQLFEEFHAALAAMRNPWRNATMHLDQKYTQEEARNLFEVVSGFMKSLASRCDEMGSPKA